jgi:hypothetical protein
MKVVLDAGAFIAIERNDRRVAGLISLARREGADLTTSAAIIGQVWRDGSRQALLARLLPMVDTKHIDVPEAKRAGELLKLTKGTDIVDALLSLLATPGDQILTSDPDDLSTLVEARNVHATMVKV